MLRKLPLILALSLLTASSLVCANDSTARVGAGGITLLKSKDIRMLQEILEISTKRIRVRYQFLNESSQDIQATVAFPMPAYGLNAGQSALDLNMGPLKSFNLSVDGQPRPTQIARRAVIGSRDVTNQLRKIGLSDKQIFETFGDCVWNSSGQLECGLSKKQETEISRLNLNNGADPPGWSVSETAYWEQLFPAGKVIEVEHEYPPFVGMVYNYPRLDESGTVSGIPGASWQKDPKEACLEEGAKQAISKRLKALANTLDNKKLIAVTLNDVEYILGTGRNWKGPISSFKLIIEKDSPDQLISLCFPGKANKISPTALEFSHTNFVPQDKLVIYFYSISTHNK